MFKRKYQITENFQDKIARLYGNRDPQGISPEDLSKHKGLTRTCTLQVTDACNLACTYCYQINKHHHRMSFDVAKRYIDMILEDDKDNDYINSEISEGLVVEFIGGEPFLEIDLITDITDYLIGRMIELDHPWLNKFMISICSNGVLYFDPRVQDYIEKHKHYLSFSISIDGNKELHDSCRVFPDGRGSYDIAIKGVNHFREHHFGHMGSKMTLAPGNIDKAFDAVVNLIDLGYQEIFLNCVYEKGWTAEHALILYEQLKKISDYLIENDLFDKIYLSIFDDTGFSPMSVSDNQNWCGGTGSMLSCDYKGDLYPCIRYMESSLGDDAPPLKIGNVYDGLLCDEDHKKNLKCLRCITRRSQSTDECFYCPIAKQCSWCSAYNYQEFGTADHRATYICIMHKARALANAYLWNKGFRKYAPWFRFKLWMPEKMALEIIPKEEWEMLKELESFDESNLEDVKNFDIPETEVEYIHYKNQCITSGKPVLTNNVEKDLNKNIHEVLTVDGEIKKILED